MLFFAKWNENSINLSYQTGSEMEAARHYIRLGEGFKKTKWKSKMEFYI